MSENPLARKSFDEIANERQKEVMNMPVEDIDNLELDETIQYAVTFALDYAKRKIIRSFDIYEVKFSPALNFPNNFNETFNRLNEIEFSTDGLEGQELNDMEFVINVKSSIISAYNKDYVPLANIVRQRVQSMMTFKEGKHRIPKEFGPLIVSYTKLADKLESFQKPKLD